jgi:hypothetical protein
MRTLGSGICHQEFQLAGLIPTKRQPGQVIALDKQCRPA